MSIVVVFGGNVILKLKCWTVDLELKYSSPPAATALEESFLHLVPLAQT